MGAGKLGRTPGKLGRTLPDNHAVQPDGVEGLIAPGLPGVGRRR